MPYPTVSRSNFVRGILAGEIFAGGTANRVMLTTDGVTMTLGQIVNAQVDNAAAIAYSKLNLATSIVNADVSTSAAIATSKLATSGTKGYALVGDTTGALYDPIGRKNILLNGDMIIKQRETMPTTDDAFCLDRWNLLLEAANAATVTQEDSGIVSGSQFNIALTVGSGNNNKFGIVQLLEYRDCTHLRSQTVSLQMKMKATAGIATVRMAVIEWTGTLDAVTSDVVATWQAAGTNPTLATSWAYSVTPSSSTTGVITTTTSYVTYKFENIALGSSFNNLAVFIWTDDKTTTQTTDVLRLTDVQLEHGTVCTQVERLPVATSLLACKRYYEQWGGTNGMYLPGGVACIFTTVGLFGLGYVEKRTIPTVTISNVAHWEIVKPAGAAIALSSFATGGGTVWTTRLDLTDVTGSLVAGNAGNLRTNTASGYMYATAEL